MDSKNIETSFKIGNETITILKNNSSLISVSISFPKQIKRSFITSKANAEFFINDINDVLSEIGSLNPDQNPSITFTSDFEEQTFIIPDGNALYYINELIQEEKDEKKYDQHIDYPVQVDPRLSLIIGNNVSTRRQVTDAFISYVKEQNLQKPNNQYIISCNKELKQLLNIDEFLCFNIQKILQPYIF
jgi:hypothetical protein